MKKEKESWLFAGVLFILLPYLFTVILQGRAACPVSREISMEEYAAAVTASQISWDSSKEAIKAQTIIARTNLYLKWKNNKGAEIIQKAAEDMKNKKMNDKMIQKFQVFQDAAIETKGEILKWNDEVREIPYHLLSQGKTRDGKEVLGENFEYIPSVETPEDIDSPLYVKGCYFSMEELEKQIKKRYSGFTMGKDEIVEIKSADSAGYVMEIQIGNQVFQGEKIKEILELPSACFTVQRLEKEVRFLCKGIGHGMGMSQYTAQKMAEDGKNYEEILKYFFPKMQLEMMYNFSYSGNPMVEDKKGADCSTIGRGE